MNRDIPVVCAILVRDGLVLAAQRSATMRLPLKWEFPGGKIEAGESPEGCLHREILEELGVRLTVRRQLPPSRYLYPQLAVVLYPFVCTIAAGEITLREHAAALWLPPDQLLRLDWAEADRPVLAAFLASP
jgi:8-oxo-dGTP diphosphatase